MEVVLVMVTSVGCVGIGTSVKVRLVVQGQGKQCPWNDQGKILWFYQRDIVASLLKALEGGVLEACLSQMASSFGLLCSKLRWVSPLHQLFFEQELYQDWQQKKLGGGGIWFHRMLAACTSCWKNLPSRTVEQTWYHLLVLLAGVADSHTILARSSRHPTGVRLNFCLRSPNAQSGANLVCPTIIKLISMLWLRPAKTLHARYCIT